MALFLLLLHFGRRDMNFLLRDFFRCAEEFKPNESEMERKKTDGWLAGDGEGKGRGIGSAGLVVYLLSCLCFRGWLQRLEKRGRVEDGCDDD